MAAIQRAAFSLADFASGAFRACMDFLFRPADPTTLGLIRICAGLAVLYVHLAYCYDLAAFFGPNGWMDLRTMNELRRDGPILQTAQTGWKEEQGRRPEELSEEEKDYSTRWNVNPSWVKAKGHKPLWSIWYHVTDPTWMWVVHCSILTIMFLFAIGLCTRIMAVLTWVAMLSYFNRSQVSLYGMDTIMNVVVFYLMIGPSGAALSVDRLIARYWTSYKALRKHRPAPSCLRPAPLISANLALRLMQIHVCFIYGMSGLSKLQGGAWWSGTAVWFTMANPEFSPMRLRIYTEALRQLSEHRWLWELFTTGGTYFTLAFEIGFPFLIWNRRLRWTMICCAVMLHLGIAVFMGLVTFSMMMLVAVLAFVPAATVREFLWRLGRGPEGWRLARPEAGTTDELAEAREAEMHDFQLAVDSRNRRQVRRAALIQTMDVWSQIELEDSSATRQAASVAALSTAKQAIQAGSPLPAKSVPARTSGLLLTDKDGQSFTGYGLFERLVRSLRLLWPVALLTWIPGVAQLGRAWYPQSSSSSPEPPFEPTDGRGQKMAVAGTSGNIQNKN